MTAPGSCPLSAATGETVRRLRKERGQSILDFACEADISPSMVTMLETGDRNFTVPTLAKVAAAFGMQAWELLKPAGSDGQ